METSSFEGSSEVEGWRGLLGGSFSSVYAFKICRFSAVYLERHALKRGMDLSLNFLQFLLDFMYMDSSLKINNMLDNPYRPSTGSGLG